MNYIKHYLNLMEKARGRRTPSCYCEKHHIIPKSIYDQNIAHESLNKYDITDKNYGANILSLTAKEHFIAHMLLVKIFDGVDKNCYIKMLFAFNIFKNKYKKSKDYGMFRERFSKEMSILLTGKPSRALGKKWSEESKKRKSDTNPLRGKTYVEVYGEKEASRLKKIRSKDSKNRIVSPETKLKLSNRIINKEWKQKISESRKGMLMSQATKDKIKNYMLSNSPSQDNTWYKFYHNSGEELYARKSDMVKIFQCLRIYQIINGKTIKCRGWSYKGEFIITPPLTTLL